MKDYFLGADFMKKTILAFTLCLAVIVFSRNFGQAPEKTDVTLYLPDRYMMHLIPVTTSVAVSDKSKTASQLLSLLSSSGGKDTSFIRYFEAEDIKVKLDDEIATVILSRKLAESIPKDRDGERLFVYHIVNSLCSLPDVKYVRFSKADKEKKNLFIFADDRELFSANYDV